MTLLEHIAELRQKSRGALTRRERNAVRTDRVRHRGDVRARRHIENIENEEIADRMALREQGGRHDRNASVRR